MKVLRFVKPMIAVALIGGVAGAGYVTRDKWLPMLRPAEPVESAEPANESSEPATKVIVGDRAQTNLGLTAKQLKAETVWKSISVPGMVVDRPGFSDRSIAAPVTAIVSAVHRVPGDIVLPGELLFTLKLLSESLHLSQTELFKATQDIRLAQAQRKLLVDSRGAVAESRVIEVDNQIARFEVAAKAYRQDLLNRGLSTAEIDSVAGGKFVSAINVVVPPRAAAPVPSSVAIASNSAGHPPGLEVQELKVELGQQVQAGQTLCLLANHHSLAIEGKAFRDETPLLERSVREGWPVAVDFREDLAAGWGALGQEFHVRYIGNTVDPVNRTFSFLVPLENQSRALERDGRTIMLWRFRPGQRLRLQVRTDEVKNALVLPPDAVAHDGGEAFVFTQNVNTFERKPVRVLFAERDRVVIANDGSLPTYVKDNEVWTIPAVVQSAATQLSRMVKAGSSGVPKGFHIHADGSLHKNEDEGK